VRTNPTVTSPIPSLFENLPGVGASGQFDEDYDAEHIKILGASASTVIGGWTVNAEISAHYGAPAQINDSDLGSGAFAASGPLAFLRFTPSGEIIHGFKQLDFQQYQLSTIKTFPNLLGAQELLVVGEAAYQYWDDIGNPLTSQYRYGRNSYYGLAQSTLAPGLSCNGGGLTTDFEYCQAKGFGTSGSAGLRAQATLDYENVFAGINLSPRLFYSWDINGYSPDGVTFIEGRWNIGLGLHAELNKVYYADLTYSTFNHNAKYDTQADRDFISVVVGATF